jgi:hypothetical protein
MRYPKPTTKEEPEPSRPLLVTSGPSEVKKRRCGIPLKKTYKEDRKFIYINHLHDKREEQGEGITSFYVIKSRYFAFFGKPTMSGRNFGTGSLNSQTPGSISRGLKASLPRILTASLSEQGTGNIEDPTRIQR